MQIKLCSVCKQQKSIEDFGPEKRRRGGRKYLCRECESERNRVRYHNVITDEERRARIKASSMRAKQRWADKRERGECTSCSELAVSGHAKCQLHLDEAKTRESSRRKRLAEIGVCTRCGQKPQARGMRYCTDCLITAPRNRRWAKAPKPKKWYRKERQQELRQECFAAYGGAICKCCGESEPRFLTIDHVNNDGADHRHGLYESKGRGEIYRWLRRHGYPDDFQVLCFNCNCGRQLNGGICPHKQLGEI